jgi:hypothetical protein
VDRNLSPGAAMVCNSDHLSGLPDERQRRINLFGVDGHVHELYNTPGAAGAGWVDNDSTALANAVAPVVGDRGLHGYWGNDSSQHVNFIGVDDDLHELYITPSSGWMDNNLTQLA